MNLVKDKKLPNFEDEYKKYRIKEAFAKHVIILAIGTLCIFAKPLNSNITETNPIKPFIQPVAWHGTDYISGYVAQFWFPNMLFMKPIKWLAAGLTTAQYVDNEYGKCYLEGGYKCSKADLDDDVFIEIVGLVGSISWELRGIPRRRRMKEYLEDRYPHKYGK